MSKSTNLPKYDMDTKKYLEGLESEFKKLGFVNYNTKHINWMYVLVEQFPHVLESERIESEEIAAIRHMMKSLGLTTPNPTFITTDPNNRVNRGLYKLAETDKIASLFGVDLASRKEQEQKLSNAVKISLEDHLENIQIPHNVDDTQREHIPSIMKEFNKTPEYDTLERIIRTGLFHPVYLYGNTGTGKTTNLTQVCANIGRGLVRVNITQETDETDILGSWALKSAAEGGGTQYEYGPAIIAMKTGSVLLLDELDLGTPKIMCLQPILEGNPIYIKKTREWIHPAPGFTVVATANTKGQGTADHGNFVGAQFLNEAFMDRFPTWIHVDYTDEKTETELLQEFWRENMPSYKDKVPEDLIRNLVHWASKVRKAYNNDECDASISTRRLKDFLVHSYIFYDKSYSDVLEKMTERYSMDVQEALTRNWGLVYDGDRNECLHDHLMLPADYEKPKKTTLKKRGGKTVWENPNRST